LYHGITTNTHHYKAAIKHHVEKTVTTHSENQPQIMNNNTSSSNNKTGNTSLTFTHIRHHWGLIGNCWPIWFI